MGLSMTGRLPNPIFEGDFHPMPSGWAETKLSSRHGDEEHAVVPQPAAPFIRTTKSFGSGPPVKTDRKIKVHSRAWKDSERVRMRVRSRLVVVHHRRNSL